MRGEGSQTWQPLGFEPVHRAAAHLVVEVRARLHLGDDLPATAIIDRDGLVVGRIIGMVEKGDLEDRIEWLLSDRSTPAPAPFVDNTAGHEGHEHAEGKHAHGEAGKASTVPN